MVETTETPAIHESLIIKETNDRRNGVALKKSGSVEDDPVEDFSPPDGGTRAWLVTIGSFFCNGILFGVINSYSVLYAEFYDTLKSKGSSNPSSEAALVGSLAMGATFMVSAVAGILTDIIGLRRTTFLGGLIASSGMFLSSFCVDNVVALYITFGIMYGSGGALAYTPSLAVLGHYFKKNLGVVNGLVTAGSSIFTIAMPYVIDGLLKKFGIEWTLRVLALIAAFIMVAAFFFKPIKHNKSRQEIKFNAAFLSLSKNKPYIIWIVVIAISLFGYFVPYVYMLKFVQSNFPSTVDGKLPVLSIGITSGVGRLIFGYIADFPKINRIILQQIAFLCIGVLTMLLAISTQHFGWLIVISLGMGLFDGCFIALLAPIAFDICGKQSASQAIGFLLGTCSIPLIIGPYVAGIIYEKEKSYTVPFILAGIPPILGSVMLLLMFCAKTTPSNPARETLKTSNGTCKSKTGSADTCEEDAP